MGTAAKIKMEHVCRECGFRTPRWLGKCPECEQWGSLAMERAAPGGSRDRALRVAPTPISQIPLDNAARDSTSIGEFDRVLGGGFVAGSVILLGGDPGIGKSTLLLTAMDKLARLDGSSRPVLYVSGEESLRQTRLRGERLGTTSPNLLVLAEIDAEEALAAADGCEPRVLVVDSIQTMHLPALGNAPGSIVQVREVAARLVAWAKRTGTPTILVGHVTKDGTLAGPRLLEHMVDTVLYFEGDRSHSYRVLRAHKNRFGSTNEIGVFEMRTEGLCEVPNPSALFLAERPRGSSGSAVLATMNGSRPLLAEVQALVGDTSAGSARRTAIGVDPARVALLTAVLEKKEGVLLSDRDVYVNVVGGAVLDEPAGDLAVAAALVSSAWNRPIDPSTLILGEVGLAGEVRAVGQVEQRLSEAAQLGFARCVLPAGNAKRLGKSSQIEIVGAASVGEALQALFP